MLPASSRNRKPQISIPSKTDGMNKIAIFITMTAISILSYANIERFFIGDIEVSRQDFIDVDSALIRTKETWTSADTTIHIINPGIYANIDSVSLPGRVTVTTKPEEEIAKIDSLLNAFYLMESARLKPGDKIPDFTLGNYLKDGEEKISYKDRYMGKVLLINFWASWCGPCIEELKSTHLPAVINSFAGDNRFVFLPVSVNHSRSELDIFFNSPSGKGLEWLKHETAWDKDGEFAKKLSTGGIPITILVDSDGTIRLNESKAMLENDDLHRLKSEIAKLLHLGQQSQVFDSHVSGGMDK